MTILFPFLSLKFTPSYFLYNSYPLQSLTQTHTHTHTHTHNTSFNEERVASHSHVYCFWKKQIGEKRKGGTFKMACHLTFLNVIREESL